MARFEPWDTFWESTIKFLKNGDTFEEALPKIKKIVSSKKLAKEFEPTEHWDEINSADYSKDKDLLESWVLKGLKGLAKHPTADVIHIELGDCPETFSIDYQVYHEIDPDEVEDHDINEVFVWEASSNVDETASKLKAFPFPVMHTQEKFDMNIGYFLWLEFACLTIAERFKKKDLAQYLGDRDAVIITIGFEVAITYGGTLTKSGWEYLEFIEVHKLQN